MPRRTFTLSERVPADCRLTPADVAVLLAEHRGMRLAPAGPRGHYRVTAAGRVGTLVLPSCRLVLRPKISLANVFHLLDPLAPVHEAADHAVPEAGDEVLDFLAGRLVRRMADVAGAGLHRGYVEQAQHGPFLQGRLDLAAQAREPAGRKDRLHSRRDELTADVPCNQAVKATAECVLASPLLRDQVRAALRQAVASFAGVRTVELGSALFAAAEAIRPPALYRPLLDLCWLLAGGLAPGEAAGSAACPAFLLDMERVFERYVTQGFVEACGDDGCPTVAVQPDCVANRPVVGQPDIRLRPDLLLTHDGRPEAVIDVKWKDIGRSRLSRADLYQVLAYCTALGVGKGLLVYPGRQDRRWTYPLAEAPVCLEIRTLRVAGPRERCARSLRRLACWGLTAAAR